MVPVAQKPPLTPCVCPTVSAVGLAWWHGAKRRWRSSMFIRCRLRFAGATTGLNAPFTLRQIDEAEFEQRLNAVWQRDSSKLAS